MPTKAIVTLRNSRFTVTVKQFINALVDGADGDALRVLAGVRQGRTMPSAQDVSDIKDATLTRIVFDSTNATLLAACDGLAEAAAAIEFAAAQLGVTATLAEIRTRGAAPTAHGSAGPVDIRIECVE